MQSRWGLSSPNMTAAGSLERPSGGSGGLARSDQEWGRSFIAAGWDRSGAAFDLAQIPFDLGLPPVLLLHPFLLFLSHARLNLLRRRAQPRTRLRG
jgi:hypothetical protein